MYATDLLLSFLIILYKTEFLVVYSAFDVISVKLFFSTGEILRWRILIFARSPSYFYQRECKDRLLMLETCRVRKCS